MAEIRPETVDARPTTPRGGGTYERVTVNLTEKASQALADAVRLSRDSKTDCVNKALQLYALLLEVQNAGGAAYLREKGQELERIRIF